MSNENKEMSSEEIEAKRKEFLKFYEEELPLLRLRAEYEKKLTKIAEARFQRLQIQMAEAQMMTGMDVEEPSEEEIKSMQDAFKQAAEEEIKSKKSSKTPKKRTLQKHN